MKMSVCIIYFYQRTVISNRCGKSPPSLKSDIIKYILGGATKLYSRNYSVPLFKRSLILNILVIVLDKVIKKINHIND